MDTNLTDAEQGYEVADYDPEAAALTTAHVHRALNLERVVLPEGEAEELLRAVLVYPVAETLRGEELYRFIVGCHGEHRRALGRPMSDEEAREMSETKIVVGLEGGGEGGAA